MISDVGVVHNDTSLQTNTGSDLGARSDNNVGADQSSPISQGEGKIRVDRAKEWLSPTGRSQLSKQGMIHQSENKEAMGNS